MARTYANTPVLSSQKIGETKYFLKDKDARAVLDAINADVYESLKLALGTVAGNDDKLVTAANIKSYVDQAVAVGIQIVVPETGVLPDASAATMGKLYLIPNAQAEAGTYIEYITLDKGADVYAWEQIGSTQVDLSNYVQKSTTIAGIDLSDNITAAELSTALDLKAMAHAAQGTATVNDYVTGVANATTTASGTVELNAFTQTATAATLTKSDYTPAGTISTLTLVDDSSVLPYVDVSEFNPGSLDVSYSSEGGVYLQEDANVNLTIDFEPGSFPTFNQGTDQFTAGTLPTKAADTFTANTPTAIDTTKFSGGSKAADTFTQGSFTQGTDSFTAATLGSATKAAFATNGIVASIDSSDDECLVFTAALTASAVTEQGAFNGGSFTQGTDAFTKPTFTEGAFTPAAIQTGFYTAGTAATFTEGAFTQGTLPSFTQGVDSYTGGEFPTIDQSETYGTLQSLNLSYEAPTLSVDYTPASLGEYFFTEGSLETYNVTPTFTGTSTQIVTGVTYDKATANGATFTGTQSTVDVSLTKGSKTITVDPKNE